MRALESRAEEENVSPGSLESPGDPADRAVKRACARFFGALDAVQAAAEKESREPGADPGTVYAAYTARVAGLTGSLHRDRKRPEYAGDDPRADLREALTGLRRMAARASHRHGASTADVYSEIAEQVAKVAATGPSIPPWARLPAAAPTDWDLPDLNARADKARRINIGKLRYANVPLYPRPRAYQNPKSQEDPCPHCPRRRSSPPRSLSLTLYQVA